MNCLKSQSKKGNTPITIIFVSLLIFGFADITYSQSSHTVTFERGDLKIETESAKDGNSYATINMPSLRKTFDAGMPDLPVKYVKLIIPSDQDVAKIVIEKTSSAKMTISQPLFPAQPDVPISIDTEPEFIKPDPSVYMVNQFYPSDVVQLVHSGYFDGSNHIVTLVVYPIQYNPITKELLFYNTIDFTLIFQSGKGKPIRIQNRNEKSQKIYDDILKKTVENPGDISSYQIRPSLNKGTSVKSGSLPFYEYVIVTSSAFSSAFNEFVSWKIRKGLDVGIVTVGAISSEYSGDLISGIYDEAGKLRQYLSEAYQNGTVWVLLAGDQTVVPIRYGCGWNSESWTWDIENDYKIPADLYFADFNGNWDVDGDVYYGQPSDDDPDYNPEIFVGRLPCTNTQDIEYWIERVLTYEQNPGGGDTDYLTDVFWIEGPNIYVHVDDIIASNQFPPAYQHTAWDQSPSHTGSEVISKMSDKYGLLNWHCHGDPRAFSVQLNPYMKVWTKDTYDAGYSGDGLDNMTNDKYYSVVYSICCFIAAFDDYIYGSSYRSMAEGFTCFFDRRSGPELLGNTRYGWQYSSPVLQEEFYDLLTYGTHDSESGESYFHLGVSELVSKQNYSNHYLCYSHNLFGCPETQVWTDEPFEFYSVSVTDNTTSITVNAGVSGCDICVSSGNDGANYRLSVSNVSNYTFSTSVRPLYITITKPNYIPYTAVTGGTFISDEYWFGKLYVLGNITCHNNSTLTVLPGTEIKFKGNYCLSVQSGSNIIAEGTEESPILFTSATGSSPGSWQYVILYGGNNIFKHCEFKYGRSPLYLYYCTASEGSRNLIENCTIHHSYYYGIDVYRSLANIKGCHIYNNRNL
ncbi:MAG: hypothetical protein JXB49_04485 [Bacteroidales bacterium]|nr:hypothetical protein [Bacteroidales bacterium]